MDNIPFYESGGVGLFSYRSEEDTFQFDERCRVIVGQDTMSLYDFIGMCHPDEREHFTNSFNGLILGNMSFSDTFRIQSAGKNCRITISADRHGDIIFGSITTADHIEYLVSKYMSELRGVNERVVDLEEEVNLFCDVLDNCPIGFIILDGSVVKYADTSAKNLIGICEEDYILNFLYEDQTPKGVADLSAADDIVKWKSMKFKDCDGKVLVLQVYTIQAIQAGKPVTMVWLLEDSDNRLYSNELRLAKDITERNARAKSEFIAEMSHEIRTPMNAILGLTDLMKYTEMSPKQREYNLKIEQSANKLFRTINNILDFSKSEVGKIELNCVDFQLNELLMDLQVDASTKASEKDLKYEAECTLQDMDLHGDPIRLNQILQNLIDNAIRYTHEGTVKLSITDQKDDDNNTVLTFAISDTGVGMSESQKKMLFAPMSQVDATAARKYGGAGLSLMICKNLVELMGGKLWCESEVDKGSTFFFTAVFKPFENRQQGESPDDMVVPEELYDDSDPVRNAQVKILVVEDVDINRMIINEYFNVRGYIADYAFNGEEALEMIKANDYDIVFMDIRMPVMDGLTATREIRKMPGYSDLPIIAMTAHARAGDKEKSLRTGMNSYLTKPVESELVYRAIRQYVRK